MLTVNLIVCIKKKGKTKEVQVLITKCWGKNKDVKRSHCEEWFVSSGNINMNRTQEAKSKN